MVETKIEIKLTLLRFIKDSLNTIIEFDNSLNMELEKVYIYFEGNHSSKGLNQACF